MQPQLNLGSYASAMSGYKAPQASAPASSNPLGGILGMALNMLPFVVPEIGIPARMALGAVTDAASSAIQGQPFNLGQDIMGGVSDGIMGGMMGGAGKAAEDVAAKTAASDLAAKATQDGTSSLASDITTPTVASDLSGTAPKVASDLTNSASTLASDISGTAPTLSQQLADGTTNGYIPGTYVNFRQYPTGTITPTKVILPETTPVTPETTTTPAVTPVETSPTPTAQQPEPVPVTQTSPTDTFTQAPPPEGSTLNAGQKVGNSIAQTALEKQIGNGGSRLTQAEKDALASNLNADGYSNLSKAAQDAQLVTGRSGILSNGVNDHINNAEANGAAINLGDYNQLAHQHINDMLMSGVVSPAQEKAAYSTLNSIQPILMGPGGVDPTESGALTHVLPSNTLKAVQALGKAAHDQGLIAQGRGVSAEGANQLKNLYNNFGSTLMDRGFGVANGNSPVSDANLQNMIDQVKTGAFNNPTYQQNLIAKLESGKGGNMSLQNLRHLQANHVSYSNASSPNEISNLTNGLMSAGLNKAGLTNAVINSDPALTVKAKAGQLLKKLSTPTDSRAPNEIGTTKVKSGGIMKTPLGKAAGIAGILGALGLGADTALTGNQAGQANATLNSPQYQQTQNILNQSNALQRYLGQMGEIRSVFAPTFDPNAAQAGTNGMALLQAANNNSAARMASNNLLTARSQMGQGGILGNILAMIPGTPENTYAKQAANAQAQLNALGVPGVTPSVAQSGNTIPALAGMAGNVGGF